MAWRKFGKGKNKKGRGKGKGRKGKFKAGHGKGFSVGQSHLSLEERQRALENLKSETDCQDCGQRGHWRGDAKCPKGKGKGSSGSGRTRTGYHSVAELLDGDDVELEDDIDDPTALMATREQETVPAAEFDDVNMVDVMRLRQLQFPSLEPINESELEAVTETEWYEISDDQPDTTHRLPGSAKAKSGVFQNPWQRPRHAQ